MKTYDRRAFFDAVRSSPFKGSMTQQQVDGMNSLLDEWESLDYDDERFLAMILAHTAWETGRRMVPVREGFAKTDAEARAVVAKLYMQGRIKANYARPVNGVSYYGRGRIQNTWYDNYVKLQRRFGYPFVAQPDLLLDDKIDAKVSIIGHIEGIWRGHKLAEFFTDSASDPFEAREIVNGDKDRVQEGKRIGDWVADLYATFLSALRKSEVREPEPAPLPLPLPPSETEGQPVPQEPPVEPEVAPGAPSALPDRSGPLWAVYVTLASYFGDPVPSEDIPMKTGFIGTSIVGNVLVSVIADALSKVAQSPSNNLTPQEAPTVAIDTAIQAGNDPRLKEIVARVEHATNTEPAIKSRVTQGAAGGGIAGFVVLAIALAKSQGYDLSPYSEQIILLLTAAGQLAASAWALYGRWKARKPIGA